jgi:hypothetical protein
MAEYTAVGLNRPSSWWANSPALADDGSPTMTVSEIGVKDRVASADNVTEAWYHRSSQATS